MPVVKAGIFHEVPDCSHFTCISLAKEHNELLMKKELRLGQFFYLDKLEAGTLVEL